MASMAESLGTSCTMTKAMEMMVPIRPVTCAFLAFSALAILQAAAEEYPKPTIAPKEVRSTNQLRVLRPNMERTMDRTMMNTML